MKKNALKSIAMLVIVLFLPLNVFALVATHGLDVKRIRNWAPKYLTVVNNYENVHFENAPSTLRVFSVITAVNGNSTEFMDEDEFHRMIDQPGDIELSYMTKLNGENRSFIVKLRRKKGFYIFQVGISADNSSYVRYWNYGYYQNKELTGPQMITDEEVDFFEYSTFDYAYGDEDERLEKKTVLSKLAKRLEEKGLSHVTEAPDLYIYVTQDINRNIETVYQPTITSTTDSHATSGFRSNGTIWNNGNFIHYRESGHGYVNGRSQTVTSESGNIRSYETNDVYLQLSILDAKKIGNKVAPKVWQITYDKRLDRRVGAKFIESLVSLYSKNYPFGTDDMGYGLVCEYHVYDSGMFIYPCSADAQIVEVIPGSWAEQIGIKPGSNIQIMGWGKKWHKFIEYRKGRLEDSHFIGNTLKIDGKKKFTSFGDASVREKASFRIDTRGL